MFVCIQVVEAVVVVVVVAVVVAVGVVEGFSLVMKRRSCGSIILCCRVLSYVKKVSE